LVAHRRAGQLDDAGLWPAALYQRACRFHAARHEDQRLIQTACDRGYQVWSRRAQQRECRLDVVMFTQF
jgi:hypothetical protein